jgi:hypothetical protein
MFFYILVSLKKLCCQLWLSIMPGSEVSQQTSWQLHHSTDIFFLSGQQTQITISVGKRGHIPSGIPCFPRPLHTLAGPHTLQIGGNIAKNLEENGSRS